MFSSRAERVVENNDPPNFFFSMSIVFQYAHPLYFFSDTHQLSKKLGG